MTTTKTTAIASNNGMDQPVIAVGSCDAYPHVVKALEELETAIRIQHIPSLQQRAHYVEAAEIDIISTSPSNDAPGNNGNEIEGHNHKSKGDAIAILTENASDDDRDGSSLSMSLSRKNLKQFSLALIENSISSKAFNIHNSFQLSHITCLNVSHNELADIPGLSQMPNIQTLDLERNWFNTLPLEIGSLTHLTTLNASRNFLRPNGASLLLPQLKLLTELTSINLLYNQKCGRPHHKSNILTELPQVKECQMTLWEEVGKAPGSYVGASAAERNPQLLRSQLEPLKTVHLRQRLVQDFGQVPTCASKVDRAGVMERLLECYQKEGLVQLGNNGGDGNADDEGVAQRMQVYTKGTPVSQDRIDALLVELRAWTDDTGKIAKNRERPSIQAGNYMILRSPNFDDSQKTTILNKKGSASRRAIRKMKKLERYRKIWDLAQDALRQVDPIFADRCTEIAVTYGFRGSPHIDKQNCGPFYGFAMGDFKDGQGGVCAECSARVVCVMDTKNRLGRVDGRYPHWVAPYDEESERYSLIYYETGNAFVKPGPAIFAIPEHDKQ